jgi:K+-transporting ATPase ATPase B chain
MLALGPIVEHLQIRSHAMSTASPRAPPNTSARQGGLCTPAVDGRSSAAIATLVKLDPLRMIRNPVMFVVEIGSAFTTILFIHAAATGAGDASAGYGAISPAVVTVLFANRRGNGRGSGRQADASARRKDGRDRRNRRRAAGGGSSSSGPATRAVEAGQVVPGRRSSTALPVNE